MTPCDRMRQLLCVLLRWFSWRKFVFAGCSGYGTHALARFATRQPRVTLISKFYKDANLYDPDRNADLAHLVVDSEPLSLRLFLRHFQPSLTPETLHPFYG